MRVAWGLCEAVAGVGCMEVKRPLLPATPLVDIPFSFITSTTLSCGADCEGGWARGELEGGGEEGTADERGTGQLIAGMEAAAMLFSMAR